MAARRARRELRCVRARRRRRAVRRARRRRRAGRADARRVRPRRRPGVKREHLVAALALLALVAASLFANRPEPPAAATRASGDFSFGGYRAFSELLAREGIRVERFRRHHDALGESGIDTLVVAFPDEQLGHLWNAAERDALRAWVRRGGNLVDIGLTPTADKNDLKGERVVLAFQVVLVGRRGQPDVDQVPAAAHPRAQRVALRRVPKMPELLVGERDDQRVDPALPERVVMTAKALDADPFPRQQFGERPVAAEAEIAARA